jgi:hypothetical protein
MKRKLVAAIGFEPRIRSRITKRNSQPQRTK